MVLKINYKIHYNKFKFITEYIANLNLLQNLLQIPFHYKIDYTFVPLTMVRTKKNTATKKAGRKKGAPAGKKKVGAAGSKKSDAKNSKVEIRLPVVVPEAEWKAAMAEGKPIVGKLPATVHKDAPHVIFYNPKAWIACQYCKIAKPTFSAMLHHWRSKAGIRACAYRQEWGWPLLNKDGKEISASAAAISFDASQEEAKVADEEEEEGEEEGEEEEGDDEEEDEEEEEDTLEKSGKHFPLSPFLLDI